MPQCGYCILPSERYKADMPSVSVRQQSEWALQDAEDERLLQEEDMTSALAKYAPGPCSM